MQNNKIGSGLHNLGNTCFFNAVMQVILYTPALVIHFNNKKHSQSCIHKGWCIFCSLEKLWQQSKLSRVVSPNAIVSNLKSIFKKFRLGRQEDSHEFLRYLVEGMQDAETGKLGKDRILNQKAISKTYTYHTFGGKMRTFVSCLNCHHKSLTTQRYYDLSIECQRQNSLNEGLESYFKVDELTGANKYRCDSCKQLSNARKGFKIISVPSVVTFQLKRFTNTLRKLGKSVQYPKSLNLSKYMENSSQNEIFQLFGVVVHSGSSASSGHYYSFVKNGSEWFEMNDSNVSRVNEDRALKQQAYLLFYRRVNEQRVSQNDKENNRDQTVSKKKISHEQSQGIKVENNVRKKSVDKKPRKQSQEVKTESKRKLSSQIENLIQEVREQSKFLEPKITDGIFKNEVGKINFSSLLDKKQIPNNAKINGVHKINGMSQKNLESNNESVQSKQDLGSLQGLQVPLKLVKKKSKGEIESEMPLINLVLRNVCKIQNLNKKNSHHSFNRSMRSLNKLRKFEIASKKRKIG